MNEEFEAGIQLAVILLVFGFVFTTIFSFGNIFLGTPRAENLMAVPFILGTICFLFKNKDVQSNSYYGEARK